MFFMFPCVGVRVVVVVWVMMIMMMIIVVLLSTHRGGTRYQTAGG